MITVLVPTWHRAARLGPLVRNILDSTRSGAEVIVVCEPDDDATLVVAGALAPAKLIVNARRANFAGAANTGCAHATGEYVFVGSDDLWFADGWDIPALAVLAGNPALRVCGTNDLGNPAVLAGQASTSCLVDRRYIDGPGAVIDMPPGFLVSEAYGHSHVDTELTETAKARGVWAPCLESVVEHRHINFGKAAFDETYARTGAAANGDIAIWESRRHLWETLR